MVSHPSQHLKGPQKKAAPHWLTNEVWSWGTTDEANWSLASEPACSRRGLTRSSDQSFLSRQACVRPVATASEWCSFRMYGLVVASSSPSGTFLAGQRTLSGSDPQWDPAMSCPLSSPYNPWIMKGLGVTWSTGPFRSSTLGLSGVPPWLNSGPCTPQASSSQLGTIQ